MPQHTQQHTQQHTRGRIARDVRVRNVLTLILWMLAVGTHAAPHAAQAAIQPSGAHTTVAAGWPPLRRASVATLQHSAVFGNVRVEQELRAHCGDGDTEWRVLCLSANGSFAHQDIVTLNRARTTRTTFTLSSDIADRALNQQLGRMGIDAQRAQVQRAQFVECVGACALRIVMQVAP